MLKETVRQYLRDLYAPERAQHYLARWLWGRSIYAGRLRVDPQEVHDPPNPTVVQDLIGDLTFRGRLDERDVMVFFRDVSHHAVKTYPNGPGSPMVARRAR